MADQQKKKKKKKKKLDRRGKKKRQIFLFSETFILYLMLLVSERKRPRAKNHCRLKQNRSSFAGYLKNADWYVCIPSSLGNM